MKRHKSYSFELHGIAPGALALEEWQQQVPGTARRAKMSLKPLHVTFMVLFGTSHRAHHWW